MRLPYEKEMDLMLPETNYINIKNFKELLPYFFYDDKSNDLIYSILNNLTNTYPYNHLDKYFSLNSQKRAWYKCKIELDKYTDKSYKLYTEIMNSVLGKKHIPEYPILLDYDTYKKGSFINEDKQTYKLFKYLLKENILTQEQINTIATEKATNKLLYFCISRNPIDYLFCSTNQTFSSCMNFTKSYDTYWSGLAALNADPNRFMCFIGSSKIKTYELKGLRFKHFAYQARCWGLIGKHNKIYLIHGYPTKAANNEADKLFPKLGYRFYSESNFESLFSFKPIYFEDDTSIAHIYLDEIGLTEHQNGHLKYSSKNGTTGNGYTINAQTSLNEIECFEDLVDSKSCCANCGSRIDEDEISYGPDENSYCESCFNEMFFSCTHCEEIVYNDNGVSIDNGEFLACSYCAENHYFYCVDCQNYFTEEKIHYIDNRNVCEFCLDDNYYECEECSTYIYKKDSVEIDDIIFCKECYDKLYTKCAYCKIPIEKNKIDYILNLCEDCLAKQVVVNE